MEIQITSAFLAGIVSFLAPCVLPLIPGFLVYLAGTGTTEKNNRREILINAIFFVLGFSLIFAALGILLNTILAQVATGVQIWLSRIGGGLIIVFGLYLAGLIKINFLEREHKLTVKKKFSSRYFTSFVFGLAFAAGWTPCVGPALGAILGLAASTPGSAFFLLLAYALGLGLPFLVVALFTSQASILINRYAHLITYINFVFGLLLVGLGILIFTQRLNLIANFDFLNRLLLK